MTQLITIQNPLITFKTTLHSPKISPTHQIFPKTHLKNPIISLKWPKKRSGSRTSRFDIDKKLIFNAITTVVSDFRIIPEPFDSLVRGIMWGFYGGGGNGGKIGFKLGFSGGNWGGKRRKKLGFWRVVLGVLFGFSMSVAVFFLGRERGVVLSDNVGVLLCVFGVVFGCCLLRREVWHCVFGFCFGVGLIGFGFRNDRSLVKLGDGFKAHCRRRFGGFSMMKKKKKKKKRGLRRWI
ncbi:hypothetical protein vseg_021452 [Gypsophila vaccaria]